MNEEYIKKETALTEFNKTCALCRELVLRPMCDKCSNADSIRHIKELTPADVKPIVRGEWKRIDEYVYGEKWQCTHCEETNQWRARFCPNCGADMRG